MLLKLGKLPIIAEDLGLMTDDVIALRDRFNFPGMKVLQFAFAGDPKNPFLPHNYSPNVVVYSGTHDNDTTIGWFTSATGREQSFVKKYIGTDGKEINWDLIRLASQSVADMAIYPMQDVLGLGTEARMNLPGKPSGTGNGVSRGTRWPPYMQPVSMKSPHYINAVRRTGWNYRRTRTARNYRKGFFRPSSPNQEDIKHNGSA